jgi:hypothetical protein
VSVSLASESERERECAKLRKETDAGVAGWLVGAGVAWRGGKHAWRRGRAR